MSIQDESFPHDEFLDELSFTINASRRFQFPHIRHEQRTLAAPAATLDTSASSPTTNESQNTSNESNGGRAASVTSTKTSVSDPTGFEDESKKCHYPNSRQTQKAISYQDIHSEYTKRRYKHVESKVGQYIAHMKAEDQKRRNSTKFQRHKSMPETLTMSADATTTLAATTLTNNNNNVKRKLQRFNALQTGGMDESISDEAEVEVEVEFIHDSSEYATRTTTSGSSSQGGRHESSGDDYTQLLNEKERIQSYSDYLQTKLDEKISENIRLKQNVDYMRIELSNCQDKLKRQLSQTSMNMAMNMYGALPGSRQSLQSLLYCSARSSKATQTDTEPNTPDANNNTMRTGGKNIATIQPIALSFQEATADGAGGVNSGAQHTTALLRQRTSSMVAGASVDITDHSETLPNDIDAIEHKVQQRADSSEEFIYFDKRSGRYAALEAINVTAGGDATSSSVADASSMLAPGKRRRATRRRWLRLFRLPCTRCRDGQQSHSPSPAGDATAGRRRHSLQQTYTQIPLLEKSLENDCECPGAVMH